MALINYQVGQDGGWLWNYCITWPDPAGDPKFSLLGGFDLTRESADGHFTTDHSAGVGDQGYTSNWFPVPSGLSQYTLWLVSFDQTGRRNSIIVGVTPSIRLVVQQPSPSGVGTPTAGEEWTSLVSSITASFYYGTIGGTDTNGDGQQTLIINGSIVPPVGDPTWGGYVIYIIAPGFPDGNQATGIVTDSTFSLQIQGFPVTVQVWTLYAVSVDTSQRQNTFLTGTTPEYALEITPPPLGGPGEEFTSLIQPLVAVIVGCTGNGVSPIVIEFQEPFSTNQFANGDSVLVQDVLGNSAANGHWPGSQISFSDTLHMVITGATGNGSYTGGGTAIGPLARTEYQLSADGTEQYRFSGAYQPPSADPTYGGLQINAINDSVAGSPQSFLATNGPLDTSFATDWWAIAGPQPTWDIIFLSFDVNNHQNSFVVGTTPKITVTPVVQTAGSILLTRVNPASIGGALTGGHGSLLDVAHGGIQNIHLAAASLAIQNFVSGIRPVLLVTSDPSLPDANYPAGTYSFNITAGALKKVNAAGTAWVAGINGAADIEANSITVGMLAAGVLSASNITAGTISASITITAPTINGGAITGASLSITGSSFAINLDTTNGLVCTGSGVTTTIRNELYSEGGNGMSLESSSWKTHITPGFLGMYSASGTPYVKASGQNGYGIIEILDSSGSSAVEINVTTGYGITTFGGRAINSSGAYQVSGTQVLTSRQTGPGTPGFSALSDAQTWCSNLLTALRTHGLVT